MSSQAYQLKDGYWLVKDTEGNLEKLVGETILVPETADTVRQKLGLQLLGFTDRRVVNRIADEIGWKKNKSPIPRPGSLVVGAQ